MLVDIDVEDVAHFSLDKWDPFKKQSKNQKLSSTIPFFVFVADVYIAFGWRVLTPIISKDFRCTCYLFWGYQGVNIITLPKTGSCVLSQMKKIPTEVLYELRKVVCLCTRHHKYISENRPTPEGANAQEILDRFH
jgi:hypothetical protein